LENKALFAEPIPPKETVMTDLTPSDRQVVLATPALPRRQAAMAAVSLSAAALLRHNGVVAGAPDLGLRVYPGNLVGAHNIWGYAGS
jgi:hypothetical protein